MSKKGRSSSPTDPEDYRDLCLYFILDDAKDATHDFFILKLIQVVFYAMVANKALELGVLSRSLVKDLEYALTSLWWSTFEAWLQLNRNAILTAR